MISLPPYPKQNEASWKGMTLEEMQMHRAVVQARMEIQKFKLTAQLENARERAPFFGGSSLFSRFSSVFSLTEYAFIAVKLFKMVSPLFRKKK